MLNMGFEEKNKTSFFKSDPRIILQITQIWATGFAVKWSSKTVGGINQQIWPGLLPTNNGKQSNEFLSLFCYILWTLFFLVSFLLYYSFDLWTILGLHFFPFPSFFNNTLHFCFILWSVLFLFLFLLYTFYDFDLFSKKVNFWSCFNLQINNLGNYSFLALKLL